MRKGILYSTPATKDFAHLMLIDSEHLLEGEAVREKKPPLCGDEDVENLGKMWQGIPYHQTITVGPFTAELYDAGHILGSAFVKTPSSRLRASLVSVTC